MSTQHLVQLTVDGQRITLPADSSVAAAVARVSSRFRRSVSGTSRAPLCGMGVCFECRVCIDGVEHTRACMMPVREGMQVCTDD